MITEEKKVAIATRLASLPEDKQRLLSQRLAEEGIDIWQLPIVPVAGSEESVSPLSFAQQRLWFIDQLNQSQSAEYNLFFGLQFEGELNVEGVESALNHILSRHAVLRMQMVEVDGVGHQQPRPFEPMRVAITDLSGESNESEQEAKLKARAQAQTDTPFDLTQDLLFRFELVKLSDTHHVGLFTVHHIVFDAWSVDNLVMEFSQAYHALVSGSPVQLPPLSIQYQDFAHWQRRWESSEQYQSQVEYWKKQLLGAPEQIRLDIEKPLVAVDEVATGQELGRVFPHALSQQIYGLAQNQNTTLYVTLLAAFNVLLQRYSHEQDICVGTSIANRPRLETEALLGYFVNTLVMRNHIDPEQPFSAFLQQVSQTATQAYQHQDLPFDHLLDVLQVERKNARSPLFQILFVMNNAAGNARLSLPGVTLSSYEKPLDKARFDLTLRVTEMKNEGQIRCDIEFNTQLFDAADITALLRHYQTLLSGICASPDLALCQYGLLTESEIHISAVSEPSTSSQTLHAMFEYWANKQPNALALTCDDVALTYGELNAKANQLAYYLRERGVGHESHVALMLERSESLIVGMLAVLKAGGCYVPMDVKWPSSRLNKMLEDCRAPLILSDSQLQQSLQESRESGAAPLTFSNGELCVVPMIMLDQIDEEIAEYASHNPDFGIQAHEAAYAIYTSGSTGEPKGVVIEHRQIVGYAQGVMARIGDETQSAFQFASVSTVAADLGNTAIYGALCFGGGLHLVSDEKAFDAAQVAQYMAANQVEVLKIVPTHLRGLLNALKLEAAPVSQVLPSQALTSQELGIKSNAPQSSPLESHSLLKALLPSKVLILGGEACALDLVQTLRSLSPTLRIINHYGPTEATVGALTYELPTDAALAEQVFEQVQTQGASLGVAALPIGQALPQYQTVVLDEGLNPVPAGLSGELYLGGVGVARGYHERPALNQERFVEVTLPGSEKPCRMYRTGDKATLLASGNIQFQGRLDDQVKVRGHRVELGEIEACIKNHETVLDASVAYIEQQLFAWVVFEEASLPDAEQAISADLMALLAAMLPEYMQPKTVFALDVLPVNVNGKLDRKALKQQALAHLQNQVQSQVQDQEQENPTHLGSSSQLGNAPRNDIEQTIADVWQTILKQNDIGIHDSFFALGGDSILSLQVIARLKKAGLKLLPKQLFKHPTIAELGELVKALPSFAGKVEGAFTESAGTENSNENIDENTAASASESGDIEQPTIPTAPENAVIPLSFSQQRLWFLDQLQGPNSIYNMPMAVQLDGTLNRDALTQSFEALMARHAVLRTHFAAENGKPMQVLGKGEHFAVQWDDFTSLGTQGVIEKQAQAQVLAFAHHTFEIDKPGLFRVQVLKLAQNRHWLLVNCHHMIADGWSLGVLVEEFCKLYQAIEAANANAQENANVNALPAALLPELPIQYADYAYWQHESGRDVYQAQLDYWTQHLASAPALLAMPTDRPRPQQQSYRGQHIPVQIEPALSTQLKQLAQSQGTTLYTVMLAAWQVLLHRYSGQDDICVGSPISNRHLPQTQGLVGFFANTSVLRGDLSGDPRFVDFVQQMKQVSLDAQTHQDVPFEQLVDHLNVPRETAYAPLFQVMFSWGVTQTQVQQSMSTSEGELTLSNVPQSAQLLGTGTAKFDMELSLRERPNDQPGIEGRLEFASDLFDVQSIERLWQHFTQLLSALAQDPSVHIDQIPLVLSQDAAAYEALNQTEQDYSAYTSLDDLFLDQVKQHSDKVAVRFDSDASTRANDSANSFIGEESSAAQATYAELNAQADKIAHYLVAQGVKPDDRVVVCQRRSVLMLASLLGVMRAGAAYVPVDPNYPADRVDFMIEDANAKCILVDDFVSELGVSKEKVSELGVSEQQVSEQQGVKQREDNANSAIMVNVQALMLEPSESQTLPVSDANANNLAYLIYTSGSTGKPKAVQVTRGNMVNFLCAMKATFNPSVQDALLAVTSLSFDIAVLELFLPLVSGAEVVIASETLALDGASLQSALQTHNITMMQATPASWKMLLAAGWEQTTPMTVMCGGEAFPADLAQQLVQQQALRVWNMYGPTETTVWSTICCLSDAHNKTGMNESVNVNTHVNSNVSTNANLYARDDIDVDLSRFVPIGHPIANTQIHILDSNLNPVPLGVAGELCIGGAGVTRGYLGRDDLTDERYVDTPFGRIYRTGDLARYRVNHTASVEQENASPTGVLECLGRLDQQVKVRGYRIELGEVESALIQHEQVQDAVVSVQSQQGESVLVAHVVLSENPVSTQSDGELNSGVSSSIEIGTERESHSDIHALAQSFRTLLQASLPDYMVPNGFMRLDALPLTPNGKVDRKALPPVTFESHQNEYLAPRNDTEAQLCAIWQSLLGLERVGVEDNFFELGGHSLLAARMRAEIETQLERDISLMQMFSRQTIASLAELIDNTETQFEQGDVDWMESLMDSMEEEL